VVLDEVEDSACELEDCRMLEEVDDSLDELAEEDIKMLDDCEVSIFELDNARLESCEDETAELEEEDIGMLDD
jgi:hypothetical protein